MIVVKVPRQVNRWLKISKAEAYRLLTKNSLLFLGKSDWIASLSLKEILSDVETSDLKSAINRNFTKEKSWIEVTRSNTRELFLSNHTQIKFVKYACYLQQISESEFVVLVANYRDDFWPQEGKNNLLWGYQVYYLDLNDDL